MKVFAHRGFSAEYPEASRIAYEKAVEVGADGFECDVRLTRDDIPICFHDRDLKRMANSRGWIARLTFGQIREKLDVVALDELIDLAVKNNKHLLIETKHPVAKRGQIEAAVIDRIKRAKSPNRITAMSFSLFAVRRFLKSHDDVAYIFKRTWRTIYIPTKTVAVDIELFRRSKIVRNRLADKEVFLWTVNDLSDLANLREWKIAGVISDKPNLEFR
jgi:glycerophosphoryl diester phosphodiesterase